YPGNPGPAPYTEHICVITDSGYGKIFLGKGRIKLEAETAAKDACAKEVHQTYCQSTIKCNNPATDRPVNGAICVLTDSGYSKTFKGEAKTLLEAEYNARKACGSAVHPTYCNSTIRCETF